EQRPDRGEAGRVAVAGSPEVQAVVALDESRDGGRARESRDDCECDAPGGAQDAATRVDHQPDLRSGRPRPGYSPRPGRGRCLLLLALLCPGLRTEVSQDDLTGDLGQ